MLGSILSNLLLVMGMCFFLGGIFNMRDPRTGNGTEQVFASGTAQTACSLMTLSSASLVIPATLFMVLESDKDKEAAHKSVLILSRGTAIILLLLYCLYLFFQLRTHKNLFNPEEPESTGEEEEEDEEEEDESMSAWSAAAILIGTTVVISFCADYLVDAIDPIVETGAVSKNFIGLILIPIVGNAAEHVTACVVAIKDKMDLVGPHRADAFPCVLNDNTDVLMQAMGVAVGSSVQIALLVTPFLVLLGWAIDRPMDFQFETCKSTILLPHVPIYPFCGSCGLHCLRTYS